MHPSKKFVYVQCFDKFKDEDENSQAGPIELDGRVRIGDALIAINGHSLENMKFQAVLQFLGQHKSSESRLLTFRSFSDRRIDLSTSHNSFILADNGQANMVIDEQHASSILTRKSNNDSVRQQAGGCKYIISYLYINIIINIACVLVWSVLSPVIDSSGMSVIDLSQLKHLARQGLPDGNGARTMGT